MVHCVYILRFRVRVRVRSSWSSTIFPFSSLSRVNVPGERTSGEERYVPRPCLQGGDNITRVITVNHIGRGDLKSTKMAHAGYLQRRLRRQVYRPV